jgi:hypothetical protein
VQWGGRWRPALTWPRRDYIALSEEEEKRRSNRQPFCGCQGPATAALTPASGRALRGRSTRPATGARQHTARQSKRPFDLQRSAATCEGWGGTLPPRCTPAHARAASSTRVRRLSQARIKPATAVRQLESSGGPGLNAGARRQYSAETSKERGKTTAGERRTKPVLRGSPGQRDRAATGTGRGDTAAYMQEWMRSAEPPWGVEGREEAVARAERSGAGAFRLAPLGAKRSKQGPPLFERVAAPTGGRNIA